MAILWKARTLLCLLAVSLAASAQQTRLDVALRNLDRSPSMRALLERLEQHYTEWTFMDGRLPISQIARTEIREDGLVALILDTRKILNGNDMIEPHFAHELFHLVDYASSGDRAKYRQTARIHNTTRMYEDREHEQRAIAFENQVRAELHEADPVLFYPMARTQREAQMRIHLYTNR